MKRSLSYSTVALAAVLASVRVQAIENLRLSIQGSDVILSWPSRTGETYIVQYRPTLASNTPWETLTNSLPAFSGTNWTVFVHAGAFQCGSGGAAAMAAGSGEASTEAQQLTSEEARARLAAGIEARRARAAALEAEILATKKRPPYPWELGERPPYPWEAHLVERVPERKGEGGAVAMMESGSSACLGFYRVVRNGVHFFGATNGQVFSGVVSLPVEIGLSNPGDVLMDVGIAPLSDQESVDTRPAGVELYELDETNRSPVLMWDTHRTTNGTYVLQAAVTLNGDSVVTGPPLTVTVSNQIQMPKIAEVVVNGLPIYAIIDQPNAAYTITIRNAQGQVVRTMTGQAVNYIINDFWDGTDGFGSSVLVNGSYVDVTLSYNPSFTYRVWVYFEDDFLNGEWLIAYQKGLYSAIGEAQMDNAMQQISEFAGEEGLILNPYLQILSGQADWTTMTNTLRMDDCRNVYYWGHGSPSRLGFSRNNQLYGLRARDVRNVLGNTLTTNEIQIRHAFRFVWLDGCQTGSQSSAWPQVFGIQPVQLDAQDFALMGAAPRAFLGWKKRINTASFDSSRFTFAERFFEQWIANAENLSSALNLAAPGTIGTSELAKLQIWGDPQLPKQGQFP
jgi:hypothetical protein